MIEPRTFHASGIAGQACSHRYLEDTHAEVMQKLFFSTSHLYCQMIIGLFCNVLQVLRSAGLAGSR